MKVLLVKTSSMGDVVHTLNAVREAAVQVDNLELDWLVEEAFADIAQLAKQSGQVRSVIPIAFRRWRRRKPLGLLGNPDVKYLKQQLCKQSYDLVIDAQGLLKSAYLARLAAAPIAGFDYRSAREGAAAVFYQQTYAIAKNQHAIHRTRQLFAQALGYELPTFRCVDRSVASDNNVYFFHATTWDNKRYPLNHWRDLAKLLTAEGYRVNVPWYSQAERCVARQIAADIKGVGVADKQTVADIAKHLHTAAGAICVDTGLAHLAAYLGVPTVFLFGPTRAELTGGITHNTLNLVGQADDSGSMKRRRMPIGSFAASMQNICPADVFSAFNKL